MYSKEQESNLPIVETAESSFSIELNGTTRHAREEQEQEKEEQGQQVVRFASEQDPEGAAESTTIPQDLNHNSSNLEGEDDVKIDSDVTMSCNENGGETAQTQTQRQFNIKLHEYAKSSTKYYRYLEDRTNGTCKIAPSKPPCWACYVPKPVAWFPDWIESNHIFECLGRKGLFSSSNLKARQYCIGAGLICNIVSSMLSFYVLFAISTKYNIIWATAFTSGSMVSGNSTQVPFNLEIRAGLKAMAIETHYLSNPEIVVSETVVQFNDVCDALDEHDHVEFENCHKCGRASASIIFSLFVSFFMSFPSITTSVVRLYPHYDCNCQKIFASFAAIISLVVAIYTFVMYQFRCFRSINSGIVCVDENGEFFGSPGETGYYIVYGDPTTSSSTAGTVGEGSEEVCFNTDEPYYYYEQDFHAGPGWIALAISTGLKILDMLFNMVIPTPTICRDLEEQRLYEALVTSTTASGTSSAVDDINRFEKDKITSSDKTKDTAMMDESLLRSRTNLTNSSSLNPC